VYRRGPRKPVVGLGVARSSIAAQKSLGVTVQDTDTSPTKKPGSSVFTRAGCDQCLPSNVLAPPELSTAPQKVTVGHETEFN
jgi:hypothetical protein